MGKSYFPQADAQFDEWFENLANKLPAIAQTIGLPQAELQKLLDAFTDWTNDFNNHNALKTSARAAREKKDDTRDAAEKTIRSVVGQVQSNSQTTDEQRQELAITVRDTEPTATSPDYVQTLPTPLTLVDFSQPQRAIIHFGTNPGNERENAKPKYIAGARITFRLINPSWSEAKSKKMSKFVENLPEYTAYNEWLFVADDTNSPYLHIVETDMPLVIEYRAQWFDKKMRLGPFGEAVRVTISP